MINLEVDEITHLHISNALGYGKLNVMERVSNLSRGLGYQ